MINISKKNIAGNHNDDVPVPPDPPYTNAMSTDLSLIYYIHNIAGTKKCYHVFIKKGGKNVL